MSTLNKKSSWHGPKQIGMMIYLGLLMFFASNIVGGATNTVLPVVSEVAGWDVQFLRSIAGVGTCCVVVGNFVFATITKSKGAKLANTIGLFGFAIALVVYGWTSSLTVFVVCTLVLGFFSGSFNASSNMALHANWWPTKKGIVLGFTTIGIVAMSMIWVPLAPVWIGTLGLGKLMTIYAIIILIFAFITIFKIKNMPEEAGEYPDGDAENAEDIRAIAAEMENYKSPFTLGKLFATPSVWTIGIGMGLMRMVNLAYVASIVPRLLACGYEYPFAIAVATTSGFFGLVGSVFIGALDQKLGTKKAIFIYAIIFTIAMILALFHAQSVPCVWVSSIVVLAICGGTANLIPSATISKFGRWDYSSAARIIQSLGELGAGIGIMLTGLFMNYQHMYYLGIVALIIGMILIGVTKFNLIGKEG